MDGRGDMPTRWKEDVEPVFSDPWGGELGSEATSAMAGGRVDRAGVMAEVVGPA